AGALAFAPADRPVGAHLYADRREAYAELEEHGYYQRPPARPEGRWAVYRFNAVTPRVAFAAAPGADAGAAVAALGRLAGGAGQVLAGSADAAAERSRAAAIRDVVAWNTVWDPVNARPYTASTRAWVAPKFGGWAVWQLDAFFHVLLAARAGDRATALANLHAALAGATAQGNLAALRSGRTDWVDRSHPPVGALAVWCLHRATGDRRALAESWPVLARAFRWWFAARDGNGNGLLEYGSSPVGDGHFVHTKLAAMDESAMDNSPVHDEAVFDPATHTLDVEDVGLNSLLVLEGDLLAALAVEAGRAGEAPALAAASAALAGRVRSALWDPARGIYASRRWDGRFARGLAPTSFYPMLAGIATPEQAATMVREHLQDPRRFGGPWPVASTPHDDPASLDNVYWRGRVWPCLNYLVYRALRRYRFDAAAAELAARGVAMFERGWAERRSFENYNQRTGEGGDSVDADPFYTWGALLPLIGEMELADLDPWDGLVVGCEGTAPGRAELPAPSGRWRVELAPAETRLFHDGELVLEAGFRGRLRDVRLDPDEAALTVPPLPHGGALRARVRGGLAEAVLPPDPAARRLRLRRAECPARLEVRYEPG
ncbi:MAG TPA: trehalase family glycosidase, partial [Actinomycetota bacterium]|nr:trehalase family glycosidase [Actinomycetota bacterium]